MKIPIIHGENALIPINELPKGVKKLFKTYIVGHSETGHHHVLEAKKGEEFGIIVKDNNIYVQVNAEAKIVHKKSHDIHKTLTVNEGTYIVRRKTEYDPFQKVIREVWD